MDLLKTGSPATIAGLIIAVVVDSFESHVRRRLSCVSEIGFEVIAPAIAHFYAASAVVFKILTIWVITAVDHARPAHVGGRIRALARLSMFESDFTIKDGSFASATDGVAVVQVANLNDGHCFALAEAKPSRLAVFHLKEAENSQSTEALSGDISKGGHANLHEGWCVKGRSGAQTTGWPAHPIMRAA